MGTAAAQEPGGAPAAGQPSERWNLYFQATSIGDYHGSFPALYSGEHSLQNYSERDASLTSTLYLGLRLPGDTQVYVDPEPLCASVRQALRKDSQVGLAQLWPPSVDATSH